MKTIILGNGFCGSRLHAAIKDSEVADLPDKAQNGIHSFDYNNPKYFNLLDRFDTIIITFKMDCPEAAKLLANKVNRKKVYLLSTAKAFLNPQADGTISESSLLAENNRNKAESFFIDFSTILYLGLIWGEKRQPEKWLRQGKVKNGNKLVNLIHVDDFCRIITELLKLNLCSQRILVSDGKAYPWQEIAKIYDMSLPKNPVGTESKRFNTDKLKEILPDNFNFIPL